MLTLYQATFNLQELLKCLPYELLCHSMLQNAAIRSLYAVLLDQSVIQLLTYQPPPLEIVVQTEDKGGCVCVCVCVCMCAFSYIRISLSGFCADKSELASALREVIKCLCSRSIKPSPLKPSLRLLELQKLHSVLSYEALISIAEHLCNCTHAYASQSGSATLLNSPSTYRNHQLQSAETLDLQPSTETVSSFSFSSGSVERRGGIGGGAEAATRVTTPPIVTQLMDMGFSRSQVNITLEQ